MKYEKHITEKHLTSIVKYYWTFHLSLKLKLFQDEMEASNSGVFYNTTNANSL
jgi:hypothetical protein